MKKAKCPFCGSDVNVGVQPRMGELVRCSECDAELEIVWLNPIELDSPLDSVEGDNFEYEDEDEDDDYDYDYEDEDYDYEEDY
jgi:lysine biosynthesis protein LysW